ncbi:hypothetical protein [Tautonia marina]|uniref:hypothetical protein n=1 Tax=Tautonia marina TaxID=2653855 RepID=UPI00191C1287|nr:hypothetical protein [Tautonia marina]
MKRKWRPPLALPAVGLFVAGAGFAYDLAFAGIPYPDPTPEMAARYRFHSRIASAAEWSGAAVVLVGMLSLALRAAWRRVSP